MALRRMFSIEIVETDKFLDLPHSTQCLYFHLCMTADDDGFVASANRTVREICASTDDLKLLIEKEYLISFPESSVYVVTNFLQQNQIRADRYHKTIYTKEKAQLSITKNNMYVKKEADSQKPAARSQSKSKKISNSSQDGNQMATSQQPDGNQSATSWQPVGNPVQSNIVEYSIDDDDMSADEAEIVKIYEEEIGRKPTPAEVTKIVANTSIRGFDLDVAVFAIQLAAMYGAKNITAYINKVLEDWAQHGLKTADSIHIAYTRGELKPKPKDKNYIIPE